MALRGTARTLCSTLLKYKEPIHEPVMRRSGNASEITKVKSSFGLSVLYFHETCSVF